MTKVKVHKTFTGDENFNNQCEAFIERNKWRDTFYNFYTFYEIEGYKNRVLAFVDLDKIPELLSYTYCLIAVSTVSMAWLVLRVKRLRLTLLFLSKALDAVCVPTLQSVDELHHWKS